MPAKRERKPTLASQLAVRHCHTVPILATADDLGATGEADELGDTGERSRLRVTHACTYLHQSLPDDVRAG